MSMNMSRAAACALLLVACASGKLSPKAEGEGEGESDGSDGITGDDTGGVEDCPPISPLSLPSPAALVGLMPPWSVGSDAPDGLVIELQATAGTVSVGGLLEATVAAGVASFDGVELVGTGLLSLELSAPGCDPGLSVGPLAVGETMRFEPVYLPGGRLGTSYTELRSWDAVEAEALPPGLLFEGGWLSGIPEETAAWDFEAAALEGSDVIRYGVELPIFPSDDALSPAPVDPAEPGPYGAGSLELSIPSISTSHGTSTDVAVRAAWPADTDGEPAAGPFPLIVFHHAAHSPAQIYDAYTELHGHWASHGYVVASVDGSELVSSSQSWENLSDMSSFQLAARELLLAESLDSTSALYGRIDPDRVFVAGHSRGGGASLISLWRAPSLRGALCFEQVSPLQTPSPDWGDPEGNGDRPFPTRPLLFLAAGDDLDEPWPLPHSAYDQNSGPTVFVVEHGTNHEWTYDEDTPGWTTSDSDISWEERHALDQAWSTAFLERFARGDLSYESSLFAAPALSSTLSDRGVSVIGRRYLDTELVIDDFSGEETENLLGGANEGHSLSRDENMAPYTDGLAAAGRGSEQIARIDDWTPARRLGWDLEEASLRITLTPEGAGLDLRDQRALLLRLSAPCDPPPGDCAVVEQALSVALIDADGVELAIEASEGMGALGVVGRHWGQVILPLDGFLPVDLSRVVAVELRFVAAAPPNDELWVEDPRFE